MEQRKKRERACETDYCCSCSFYFSQVLKEEEKEKLEFMDAINDPDEKFKDRMKVLVRQFDEALGCPPFDHPSNAALRIAEDLAVELEKQNLETVMSLAQVPEVNYTFPVLCAAVPEGSATAVHLPLFRVLIRSLSHLAPVVKYPLKNIVREATNILSLQDVVLINFLVSTNSLQKEQLEKIFHFGSSPPQKPQKKQKKKKMPQNSSFPGKDSACLDPSIALMEIPEELLLRIFSISMEEPLRSVVSRFITSSFVFETVTQRRTRLAEIIFERYSADLMPALRFSSFLPLLSGKLWAFFVELLDRQKNSDIIFSLTSEKVVGTAIYAWMEDTTNRWNDVVSTATGTTALNHNFGWGSLLGSMFLLHCSLTISSQSCSMCVLEPFKETLLLFVLETVCAVGKCTFVDMNDDQHNASESLWLDATEVIFHALHSKEGNLFSSSERSQKVRDKLIVFRGWLVSTWEKKSADKALPSSSSASSIPPGTSAEKNTLKEKRKSALGEKSQRTNEKGKGKAEVPNNKSVLEEQKKVEESRHDTEKKMEKWVTILFYIDELLQVSSKEKWNTLILLKGAFSDKVKGNLRDSSSLAKTTWKLFLNHVEAFGKAVLLSSDPSVCFPLFELFPYLNKAINACAMVGWIEPFVLSHKEDIHLWLRQWPVSLMVELVLAFPKASESLSDIQGSEKDALVLAGRWFRLLMEQQKQSLFTALGNVKGSFDILLSFLAEKRRYPVRPQANRAEERAMLASDSFRFFHTPHENLRETNILPEGSEQCSVEGEGAIEFLNRVELHLNELAKEHEIQHRVNSATLTEKAMQKVVEDTQRLEEHHKYKALESEKEAKKQQEKEEIKEIVRKQQEEKERRKELLQQQLQQQRNRVREIAAEKLMKTMAEREATRKKQLEEYKEDSLRAFRAYTFLHSLGFTTSRVKEILDNVVSKKKDIRPDDLLEYVVTGHACIPQDILNDSDSDDVANELNCHGKDQENLCNGCIGENAAKKKSHTRFWEAVLEDSSAWERKLATTDNIPSPSAASHSFHFRTALYLDLFCYDGGDVYGKLPETLPQVSLWLATKLIPSEEIAATGFRSVEEAFHQLSLKKLIRLKNTTKGTQKTMAQLTPLGFRYHFPFHDSDKMLAVRLHGQKEKVLALLATRQTFTQQQASPVTVKTKYQDPRKGVEKEELKEETEKDNEEESSWEEEWTDFDSVSDAQEEEDKKVL